MGSKTKPNQTKPNQTNFQLKNLLNETAKYLGDPFEYGNGLLDANNALNFNLIHVWVNNKRSWYIFKKHFNFIRKEEKKNEKNN